MSDVEPVPDLRRYRRMVLLTDGESTPFLAKTAISLLRYRTADVVAVLDRELTGKTAEQVFGTGGEIPFVADISPDLSADSLFIGIAPPGGRLPLSWQPMIERAIEQGLDIVSGLHHFLCEDPKLADMAQRHQVRLIDVRQNREKETGTGSGLNDSCFRIHTIGHDCSVGKMVATLELQKDLSARGIDAEFAATGQTGIMISGRGIPIDCVVSDFVNGAAERLVRENQQHEMLLIEGQGCITHPAYSGVTLGLLHGCAPDAMIMCLEAGRTHVKGFGEIQLQPLSRLLQIYQTLANTRHPSKVVGIALNSRRLDQNQYHLERDRIESETGLPCTDVYREGPAKLSEAILLAAAEKRRYSNP